MTGLDAIPVVDLSWTPCHRLIASRFPTVGLYDDIARPEDLDVVFAIEALTNPRIRQELGALSLVPPAERVTGPGATLVMAAFTHLNPEGSRFSDGSRGVYYAARALETAIAEVSHHRAIFLARTAEPEIDVDLRWIQADLQVAAHDLRGRAADFAEVYHPDRYGAGQALAQAMRDAGSAALAYDSVRHRTGECVAVFVPRALANARPAGHVSLHWDGHRITHWFEKGEPHVLEATGAQGEAASDTAAPTTRSPRRTAPARARKPIPGG
ncbi:RES family NAD+ phosphorylase [Ideonella sp. A 288]|uniref:RES family NAD+ phosphorylase n=1 Tax=Ideonella sp. A 288 TaxID=1962181 RepID=UPI000B4AC762|nr:RES family NAD+ phosphorylase [Ideonella sp. A 288]